MRKDRDLSFDAFRGIAIIAVVAIHAIGDIFSWKNCFTISGWSLLFIITYRQFLNFAVPAFIFISGYWISKKSIRALEDYKTFLIRRLPRILVPYFFWSSVLLGYEAVRTHHIDIAQIAFKLLTGGAVNIYYFIMVIAQFYIITPLLQYINRKRYGLILVIILNILSLLSAYLSRLHFNYWFPVFKAFYSWIIFYEIGMVTSGSNNKIWTAKRVQLFIFPAILVCLLLSVLETSILLSKYDNWRFVISPFKYSSFLYCVFVILGFLILREYINRWPGFLVTLGRYSFGIYLIHLIILPGVARCVQNINIICSFLPLYQFIVVLLTLLACFGFMIAARRLLSKSFCEKILGF